jgi:hypothetical protein
MITLDTPLSVGLLWTSDRPDADLTIRKTYTRRTSILTAGFEPAIPVSERSQTHVLDRAVTGIGQGLAYSTLFARE